MKFKVIIIVVVVLTASIYSYWSYRQQLSQLVGLQSSATDTDETSQRSSTHVPTAVHKAAPRLSLEQQLQQQFSLQTNAQSYQKQAQQSLTSSENPLDENLVTEVGVSDNSTPYPSRFNRRLDERGVLLGDYVSDQNGSHAVVRRWNASSGEMKTILSLTGFHIPSAVITKNGMLFLVQEITAGVTSSSGRVVFVSSQGYAAAATLEVLRSEPKMLLLSDQSVLLMGGRSTGPANERSNAVELIRFDEKKLSVEQLPDMPGSPRWGYALVALAKGGAMVLGGNTSQYVGCKAPDCKTETYVLDMFTKTWSDGPKLIEARADASASLLADGSILVAGGWRADSVGNALRSRSSERLLPNSNQFEVAATLAIPVAGHRFMNVNADSTSPLLLIDIKSGSVQSYDLVRNEWKAVGEFPSALDFILGPFVDNNNIYLWAGNEGDYKEWQRIALRVSSGNIQPAPTQFDIKKGLVLRAGIGFLAADTSHSAIVAGGSVSSDWLPSTAVESVTLDGKVQSLAPLNIARSNAQVFRLPDSAIVVAGGEGESGEYARFNPQLAPLEWLAKPDTKSRWQNLHIAHARGSQYIQLNNGNILLIHTDGSMEQLQFSVNAQQQPVVTSKSFAAGVVLQRVSDNQSLQLRNLPDGRLVVAGGSVQPHRIVVLRNSQVDAVDASTTVVTGEDEYVGTGEYVLSSTYDIYDPKIEAWRTSAAAHSAEGSLVILQDGRVVKISTLVPLVKNLADQVAGEKSPTHILEISNQDASSWTSLRSKNPPDINLNDAELMLVSDELFLSGKSMKSSGNIATRLIQWYDMSTQRWSTVWQSSDRIYDYHTRLLVLTLANKKTLLLPMQER